MNEENRIAEEIVSVLGTNITRACSPEKHTIRYSLRADGLKLKSIVFNRASLRRLMEDPNRAVKIEFLQRDLLDAATRRSDFRYPRLHIHVRPVLPRRFPLALPLVSAGC